MAICRCSQPLVLVLLLVVPVLRVGGRSTEELLLRPLPGGAVLAHFHFQATATNQETYASFPGSISALVASSGVREFSLAFTQGRWFGDRWGRPPTPAKPVGAELRARFGKAHAELPRAWVNLTNALSGLFCASLNFLEGSERVASPQFAFPLPGNAPQRAWRYGALPREAVCTENLTPWLKLLPCGDRGGLAALLRHRPTLYAAPYHSMRASFSIERRNNGSVGEQELQLRFVQTLTLVLNAPPAIDGQPGWELGSLFQHAGPLPSCRAAADSRLYVEVASALQQQQPAAGSQEQRLFGMQQAPDSVWQQDRATLLEYRVTRREGREPLRLQQSWEQDVAHWQLDLPRMRAHWYVTGKGEERGALVLEMRPAWRDSPDALPLTGSRVGVCVFQMVPWFVKLWFHTLSFAIDGQEVDLMEVADAQRLVPGEDRRAPATIELCLALPYQTRLAVMRVLFHKAFLSVFEHPPDAARGLDVPACVITVLDQPFSSIHCSNATPALPQQPDTPLFQHIAKQPAHQVYTEGLLVQVAQPDFSMPYNVACLSCTVVAMYVATMLGALYRRPAADMSQAELDASESKRKRRAAALVVFFLVSALYLDRDLQRQAVKTLAKLGVGLATE